MSDRVTCELAAWTAPIFVRQTRYTNGSGLCYDGSASSTYTRELTTYGNEVLADLLRLRGVTEICVRVNSIDGAQSRSEHLFTVVVSLTQVRSNVNVLHQVGRLLSR